MLGGVEQSLGRDAAPVQANAAEILFLDQQNFFAEMSGTLSHDITAGARADDDEVKFS